MLKSAEDISPTKKRLRIEIPSDVIEKEIGNSLEKLRQKTKIPGFRPGRAPINLIEKRFGKEVEAEVLERVIPEYYNKALKEAELMPVTTPVFDERVDFKRNNPLNLLLTVEVMPEIENLNYENIKVKDITVVVDENEVEGYLKKLQEEKAIYEVAEREIGMDDLVTFDYVDCEIVGGENTPSVKEQILKMGNEIFPQGIIEKAIGKKKGEVMEFTTTFNENFKSKELAGKTVNMKVMIKEVKQKILPAIDNDLAKDLGSENISALKERIKENIYKAKKEWAVKVQKAELLKKIIESHNFEVPETLFRNELESLMMEESMSDARYKPAPLSRARPGMQDTGIRHQESGIRNQTSGESMPEDLQSKLREKALRNVQASIILDVIGQKEGIMVTDDEVKEQIRSIAQGLRAAPEAVMNLYISKDGSLEGLRHSIYEDKVMDMLLSKAVFEKGE
ncbi:MAG: trigger factor [Nitrospirae bacterium]|nr:trigger factor [Nitrospirota bacterium]